MDFANLPWHWIAICLAFLIGLVLFLTGGRVRSNAKVAGMIGAGIGQGFRGLARDELGIDRAFQQAADFHMKRGMSRQLLGLALLAVSIIVAGMKFKGLF